MNRQKVSRTAGFILLYSVSGALGLYLLLLVVIHLPPVQDYLLSVLERQINPAIRGTLEVASFRTDLVNFITFSQIKAFKHGEDRDSLYIQNLMVDYSIPALLDKKVKIDAVGVRDGEIYLVRDSTGSLQFPLLPKPQPKAPEPDTAPGFLPKPWELVVDTGFVEDVNFSYRDRQLDLSTTFESLDIGVSSRNLDSLLAQLSSEQILVRSPWWNGTLDTLYTRGRRDNSLVDLHNFLISGDQARLRLSGTVPLSLSAPFNLTGNARGQLAPLVKELFAAADTLRGFVQADFDAQGTLESPRLRAVVTSPFVQYRTYELDSVYIHARYTESETLQVASFLRSPYGTVRVDGALGIPGLILSPKSGGYKAWVNADVARLSALLRKAGLAPPQVDGTADLDLFAQSDSLLSLPDSLLMTLVVNQKGPPALDTARARLQLVNARWALDALLGRGNRLSGSGTARFPETLQGDLQGTLSNPQLITEFLFPEPVTGSLTFDASFRNVLKRPRLRVQVDSDSLAWRGVIAGRLAGVVRYDGRWIIDRSSALFLADLGRLEMPGVGQIGGDLRAEVSAQGALPIPRMQADVVVTDPGYADYSAQEIQARLRFRDQTLFWDRLEVRTDTFRLSSTGQTDFLSPRRSAQAQLQLDVREKPAASLSVEGAFVDDSLHATSVVEYLVPGRIIPDLPFFPCYEGGASVRAVVGEGYCVRRGDLDFDFMQFAPALEEPYLISGSVGYQGNVLDGEVLVREDDLSSTLALGANLLLERICPDSQFRPGEGSAVRVVTRDFEYGPLVKAYLPRFFAQGAFSSSVEATLENGRWYLDGVVNVAADTLAYPPQDIYASNAIVTLRPRGTVGSPQGSFNMTARGIEYAANSINNTAVVGSIDSHAVMIRTLVGTFEDEGFISASGTVPFSLGAPTGQDARFIFEAEKVPLAFANPFLPTVQVVAGTLSGRGSVVFGEKLDADGALTVSNLQVGYDLCNLDAGPLSADLFLVNDSVVLGRLAGEVGGGVIGAKGFIQLGLWSIEDFGLDVGVRGARIFCDDFVELGIGGARISYEMEEDGYLLTSTVSFAESRFDQVISLQEIIDRAITTIPPGPIPTIMRETEVDATAVFNRNLLIDTNFGRFLLDGRMAVSGTLARPRFNGVLTVAEGTVQYLDREFEIEEGILRQFDPFEINPELDISASTRTRAITLADPADYTISVSVTGTLREPQLDVASSPPLEQQEILNLLTLSTTEGGPGLPRTGEIVSSHITGIGSQLLEQAFGIDNISVTGNLFAVPENGGLTFTVREDLTSDLTVVYQSDLLDLANQGILVNYRLFPRFRLIGQTQTVGESELGFRYTIRR
ncbi:MAG: translocation/assembly module TamB domain-containing protein [Fibrobacterota bacterium]